jgi:hypothetical protein
MFFGLSVLIFSSCENCKEGNNNLVSETRSVTSAFNAIESTGDFEVFIIQDATTSVEIEADENIINYMRATVRNRILKLESTYNKCIETSNPIRFYIHTPDLYDIRLSGNGYIECKNLNISNQNLTIEISGDGDVACYNILAKKISSNISGHGRIELSGSCTVSYSNISGNGTIMGRKLSSDVSLNNITGNGDIYTYVNDFLFANIPGYGSVYYSGYPEDIVQDITGSGSVIYE